VLRRFSGYFWLTSSLLARTDGRGDETFGTTGVGGTGVVGGIRCCDGEALPRFCMAGRWWTIFSLPGAGAM
jgi:hypothetical protein